jgi:BTB/POZ domain
MTVHVGSEKAAFTIHRGPICDTSAFSKKLFNGTFKEISEKVIAIEDYTPETFDQFSGFAYSRNLDYNPF